HLITLGLEDGVHEFQHDGIVINGQDLLSRSGSGAEPGERRQKLRSANRLHEIVSRAEGIALATLVDHGDDHHRDPGDAGIGLRRGEEIPAVDSRQKHVEGDGEGLDPASKLERLLSARRYHYLIAGLAQITREETDRLR